MSVSCGALERKEVRYLAAVCVEVFRGFLLAAVFCGDSQFPYSSEWGGSLLSQQDARGKSSSNFLVQATSSSIAIFVNIFN